MTDEMTKTTLMERIGDSWEALQRVLAPLDEAQLSRPDPASGWAIKDHLMHLAMWERGIAWLLSGRSRYEAMSITADEWHSLEMDQVNDLIYQRHRERTAAEALTDFRAAHAEMLDALAPLGDAGLQRPYADFDPSATQWADQPIIGWIIGDTYDHFDEHRGYLQTLLTS